MIGVCGGLDSTHAADRGGQGDGPARAAAHQHPRASPCPASRPARRPSRTRLGLMKALGVTPRRSTSARLPSRCSPTWTTRSPTASRSTTSPSRTCRPGCGPTTCSGWPTTAAASCSAPATCPNSRSAGAPTAWATRCRHYNVNAGVPKTLIQHLIRWVIASDQFDDDTNDVLGDPRAGDLARADPRDTDGVKPQAPRTPSAPTSCRTSPCSTPPLRLAPVKIAFLALARVGRRRRGGVAAGLSRTRKHTAYDLPAIRRLARGLLQAVLRVSQFKRSALPNGPKVSRRRRREPARRLAGAIGRSAVAWLAETEGERPDRRMSGP